ncbi:MAG: hypothetical protein PHS57_05880 [Alphaproteobacteria bacterium]|nr:hypothetical protein [Alphaproteobacteria bacterium]
MDKLINSTINAMSEIHTIVVIKRANIKKKAVRQVLFRKLVAVWYGVCAMILHLGYTNEDVTEAVKTLEAEAKGSAVETKRKR